MSGLTLRVLSRLLSYPTAETQAASSEMRAALTNENALPPDILRRVTEMMDEMAGRPLLALQEEYVGLFDRGRRLSLHLFEHVHGESRDRGQAMVDLLELYRAGGLELGVRELPDYLPLLLEYLSTRPACEVDELLGDAMGIIVLLGARLRELGARHAVLFEALEAIGGTPENAAGLREVAATEGPDQSIVQMDRIWAEEPVTFMGNSDPAGAGHAAAASAARGGADGASSDGRR